MPARLTTTRPAIPSEAEATIAAIAQTHLDQHQVSPAIQDALRAAFAAGKRDARRWRTKPAPSSATARALPGGITLTRLDDSGWAHGRVGGFRFCAKVYGEHATFPAYEIGRSRISKLELRRLDTDAVAYRWDRGEDIPAADAHARKALDLLCQYLADAIYGPA